MKKLLFLFLILLTQNSCDLILGTKNLGGGFYYDTDVILYNAKSTYNGTGFTVIPANVTSLDFNDNFIIVKSTNNKNKNAFWIVIKKNNSEIKYRENDSDFNAYYIYKNVIGPLNENEYEEAIKNYRIPTSLKLKNVN